AAAVAVNAHYANRSDPRPGRKGAQGAVMADVILSVLAHPDDAEFLCAGTMTRLVREHGWQAVIATMTPGDCGSAEHPSEEIARIRRGEAAAAAARLGGRYHCVEERDLLITYSEPPIAKV